jgi:hypothetical protein
MKCGREMPPYAIPACDACEPAGERRIAEAVAAAWSPLCDLQFVERIEAVQRLLAMVTLEERSRLPENEQKN